MNKICANITKKSPILKSGATQKHPFHLLNNSALPIVSAFSAFAVAFNLVLYWHYGSNLCGYQDITFQLSVFSFILVLFVWFISIVWESFPYHTTEVSQGLRYGFILFVASEVLFFFAFFWGYFHFSLTSSINLLYQWPPANIQTFDILGLPLLNTILLLSSGITITLAHHAITQKTIDFFKFQTYLLLTIILGFVFLICQGFEYMNGLNFRWNDNVFGSCFFVLTGFHGFHVTIGTIFLLFCWLRTDLAINLNIAFNETNIKKYSPFISIIMKLFNLEKNEATTYFFNFLLRLKNALLFQTNKHVGFETAAWYWHFVDVVWLFLFLSVYWWGGLLSDRTIDYLEIEDFFLNFAEDEFDLSIWLLYNLDNLSLFTEREFGWDSSNLLNFVKNRYKY